MPINFKPDTLQRVTIDIEVADDGSEAIITSNGVHLLRLNADGTLTRATGGAPALSGQGYQVESDGRIVLQN